MRLSLAMGFVIALGACASAPQPGSTDPFTREEIVGALESGTLSSAASRECVIEEALKQKPTTLKMMTQTSIGRYSEDYIPRASQIDLAVTLAAQTCAKAAGSN